MMAVLVLAGPAGLAAAIDRLGMPARALRSVPGLLLWSRRAAALARQHRPRFLWSDSIRPCAYPAKWTHERVHVPYGVLVHGQRSHHGVAILARGETPVEVRRGLPGDPEDVAARWLEAKVRGLHVVSVYLPNGNPVPSPNFDYKQRWMERLLAHGETLLASRQPVVLAGDFNVVPTNFDIYNAGSWRFEIDDGRVTLQQSDAEADCVFEVAEDVLVRIIRGEQNAATAYLRGLLQVRGDVALADEFRRYVLGLRGA